MLNNNNASVVCLKEIAEIIASRGIPKCDWVEEGIPYIRSRDLIDGRIKDVKAHISEMSARNLPRQLLQEGDILLSRSFGQHKIAIVRAVDVPAFSSDGLFIIRPFGVSSAYLYDYFSSKTGYAVLTQQLNAVQAGVVIPHVTRSDLEDLKVPLFSPEAMKDITNIKVLDPERVRALFQLLLPSITEADIEKKVYQDLLAHGWTTEDVRIETQPLDSAISRFRPDISLYDGEKLLGIIEITFSKRIRNSYWFSSIMSFISSFNACLVLSTGNYYEINEKKTDTTIKQLECPTKAQLLELIKKREEAGNE